MFSDLTKFPTIVRPKIVFTRRFLLFIAIFFGCASSGKTLKADLPMLTSKFCKLLCKLCKVNVCGCSEGDDYMTYV